MAPPFSTCNSSLWYSAKRKSFVQKGSNMTIPSNTMGKEWFRVWNLEFFSRNLGCFRKMQQKFVPMPMHICISIYCICVYAILQHYFKKTTLPLSFLPTGWALFDCSATSAWSFTKTPRLEFDAAWGIHIHSPPQEFQLCFHLFRLETIGELLTMVFSTDVKPLDSPQIGL